MSLDLDSTGNFLSVQDSLILEFSEINLPDNIECSIYDSFDGYTYIIDGMRVLSITDSIGNVNFEAINPFDQYSNYGNNRYFISFEYSTLAESSGESAKTYKLFQNYPNLLIQIQ